MPHLPVPGPWSPVPSRRLAAADVELVCARGVIVTMLPRTAVVGASRMMLVTVTGLEDAPPPPHEEVQRARTVAMTKLLSMRMR